MKSLLFGILILACSTGLLAQSAADDEIAKGDELAGKKQWAQAAEHYQKAVAADPASVKAKTLLGVALLRDGKRQGLEPLTQVAQMRAGGMDGFEILKAFGHELLEETGPSFAGEVLFYAYTINPNDDQVAREYGLDHSRHDHNAEAIAIWKKSLERNPDQADVKQLLADEEKKKAERNAPQKPPSEAAASASQFNSIEMKPTAGWALLPDGSTLVIALSDSAELLYLDTEAEKELKRVSLEFKPGAIVLHRGMLYVSAQGASFVYAIDPASGEQKKEIKVTGDPIIDMAAAPDKGFLYATNAHEEVICIDVKAGSATKTAGKGHHVAVDPAGSFVYTARTNPNKWDVVVEKGKDGSESYYWDDWGYRAILTKYAASGKSLKQVGVNNNAAVNGRAMCLSPDGKRIAVVGGGGWRPKAGGSGGGGYVIAFFDTGDMTTMRGQVDTDAYPENVALHPVLPIGIAVKSGGETNLILFQGKSLAEITHWEIKKAPHSGSDVGQLIFVAHGTKAIFLAPAEKMLKQVGRLYYVPLELSADDQKALEKAYGAGVGAGTDLEKLFAEAQAAEKAGDKAKAIKLYRQVAKGDPNGDLGNKAARRVLDLEE